MFKILNIKTNTLGKTAFILSFFTISSSFLAIIRDKIFTTKFGAGEILDIYWAAFKIPDLIFLTLATLISTFIIIPFFEREEKKGRENLQNFIDKLFFTFSFFIIIVSGIVFFAMGFLAQIFFPGFGSEQLNNLVIFSRIILLSPIFMGISIIFASLNQKYSYFFPIALTGVFYNLSIIFGTLFLYPYFGFNGVIFGVILGSFLCLILQLPSIFKEKKFPKKFQFFNKKSIFEILKISIPRSLALVLADLFLIFLIARATFLGEGAVTLVNFSLNIFTVPISIIAVSYSLASFPKLAKAFSDKKFKEFKELSRDVISRILFFGIPISLFFIFFSDILVGMLLGSEKFAFKEINSTALFVSILSVAMVFQAITIMIVRIFYAMGKTFFPLLANIFIGIVFISLVYFFEKFQGYFLFKEHFASFSEQTYGIFILILAYTISFILGSLVINYFFKKSIENFSLLKNSNIFKKFFISFVSVIFAKIFFIFLNLPQENSFLSFFSHMLILGFSFLVTFIFLSEIFPDKNYFEFKKKILSFLK